MALSYVGGTSGGGTGASYTVSLNGTLTGGSNSSPSAGDLILVFTGEANSASVTSTCSGNNDGSYSTIRAHQNAADTHDANLDSFYKRAGATPDTTLTITRGNNNTTYGSSTVVHVWRGAHSTAPFNVTPTIASSANGSAANPAAITPTTAGSMIVYCGHASQLAASGTAYTTAGTYPISLKTDGSTGDSIIMVSSYTAWTSGSYDPAAFTGSTSTTALAWVAVTVVIQPSTTHSTSGTPTGQGSSVNGSAAHVAKHATSGVLAGQSSTVSGSAARIRSFATSGVLSGQGSTVAGSSARATDLNAKVSWAEFEVPATTAVTHTTTGVLAGAGSTVSGSSAHIQNHQTTGVLAGQSSTLVGSASRTRLHTTTGQLSGQGSSVAGTSVHNRPHPTTGVLSGQSSTVSGSAKRFRAMATVGALYGQGSAIAGTAAHSAKHAATGVLTGQGSAISGSASRLGAPPNHATTGVLVGQDATIVGSGRRYRLLSTSGVLTGQGSTVSGSSNRFRAHSTSGVLSGQGSSVYGSANRFRSIGTSGSLTGQGSTIAGSAARVGGVVTHNVTGSLVGSGSVISGSASTTIDLMLTESAILAIAEAVWARNLPLTAEPTFNYGSTGLSQRDLDAISHAVWSKTL